MAKSEFRVDSAFLDSSGIYALADRDDRAHGAARRAYRRCRRLVTHDAVLLEVFTLLSKRMSKRVAIETLQAFRGSPHLETVPLSAALVNAGWQRCVKYAGKGWDWIDCVSFELMEQRGIRAALSLDHHFEQAGFTLLPA